MIREEVQEKHADVRIEPFGQVSSGSVHTWKIILKIKVPVLREGAVMKIEFPSGFSRPNVLPIPYFTAEFPDYTTPGYVTAVSSNKNVKLILLSTSPYPVSGNYHVRESKNIYIKLEKGSLKRGEEIVITYGDTRSGSPGAVSTQMAMHAEFKISLDPTGKGKPPYTGFYLIKKIIIDVLPLEGERLYITSPSRVNLNEKFNVVITVRDKYFNIAEDFAGKLILHGDKGYSEEVVFTRRDKGFKKVSWQSPDRKCIFYIKTKSAKGMTAISNPVDCGGVIIKEKLFWGDIHCHTQHSDGYGSFRESYIYARDISKLDFCAITDHDIVIMANAYLSSDEWRELQHINNEMSKEGKFITFLGYEYSRTNHKIVYFFNNKEEMLYSDDLEKLSKETEKEKSRRIKKLVNYIKNKDAFFVPHQHVGFGWSSVDHSKTLLLTEIYSKQGAMERIDTHLPPRVGGRTIGNHVQDGLALGYKIGFTGSSDGHDGHPGFALRSMQLGSIQYRGGLTAVYSNILTKKAIWNSLKQRKCYATTGDRIILNFQINGIEAGGELDAKKGTPLLIKIKAAGTDIIKEISIVKNNKDIVRFNPKRKSGTWIYKDVVNNNKDKLWKQQFACYYVRLIQNNNQTAWASPIWVNIL